MEENSKDSCIPTPSQVLEYSCWYEGRCENIENVKRILREDGYQVHEKAQVFLQSYVGLYFKFRIKSGHDLAIYINPYLAPLLQHIYGYNYSARAGEDVVIVGEIIPGGSMLLVGSDGGIYIASDDCLSWAGSSMTEVLERHLACDWEGCLIE